MSTGMFFVVLFVAAVVVAIAALVASNRSNREQLTRRLGEIEGMADARMLVGCDNRSLLGMSRDGDRVVHLALEGSGVSERAFPAESILAVEIEEDGHSVSSTSRTSQVSRLAVGGLLLGPIGAVVGGLSGKKVQRSKVSRVALRVAVRDLETPVHVIPLLDIESDRTSALYREASEQAREWHARLSGVIQRTEAVGA